MYPSFLWLSLIHVQYFCCVMSRIQNFPTDLTYRHEAMFKNVGLELAGLHWSIHAQAWTATAAAAAATAAQPGSVWSCECCLSISCGPPEPQPAPIPKHDRRERRGVRVSLFCAVLPQHSPAKPISPRLVSTVFPCNRRRSFETPWTCLSHKSCPN